MHPLLKSAFFVFVLTLVGCIKYENLPTGPSKIVNLNIRVYVSASDAPKYLSYKYKLLQAGSSETCDEVVNYGADRPFNTFVTDDISSFPDGEVKLCIFATTTSGPKVEAKTWTKDTTPPGEFTVQSVAPDSLDLGIRPTAIWTASSDAVSYRLVLTENNDCSGSADSIEMTTSGLQLEIEPAADTNEYVCLFATDQAGNERAASNNAFHFPHTIFYQNQLIITHFKTQVAASVPPVPSPNEFFGQAGADWVCNYAASDAGYLNDWDGEALIWKALVSTQTESVVSRATLGFSYAKNPAGQSLWVDNPVDMGAIPVGFDARGYKFTEYEPIGTGSNVHLEAGALSFNCFNYNGGTFFFNLAGSPIEGGIDAFTTTSSNCNLPFRLYCLGPRVPSSGPETFVMSAPVVAANDVSVAWDSSKWAVNYEVAIADNPRCDAPAASAQVAGLSHTFTGVPAGEHHICLRAFNNKGRFTWVHNPQTVTVP